MCDEEFEKKVANLNLNISNHAMERYAERVRGNTEQLDDETKKKYTEELKKLFLSSDLVYSGVIGRSTNEIDVYLNKNGWTLLLQKGTNIVVTLYKVDLGVDDDELNQSYITKSLEKIYGLINEKKELADTIDTNKITYLDEIDANNALIKDYQQRIDELKIRNQALNDLVKTEDSKIYQAKIKLRNALENYMVKDKFTVEQ